MRSDLIDKARLGRLTMIDLNEFFSFSRRPETDSLAQDAYLAWQVLTCQNLDTLSTRQREYYDQNFLKALPSDLFRDTIADTIDVFHLH